MNRGDGDPRGVRVSVIDAYDGPGRLELAGDEDSRLLLTVAGTPFARLRTPAPGAGAGTALSRALVGPQLDAARAHRELVESLAERLGAPPTSRTRLTTSVVVCTHRRSSYLPGALEAISALRPTAEEVIVVDNAPGADDCRDLAERHGARYVREDRRGLDRARNAGLRAASADLVAFTDDDCLPSAGWLRELPVLFDDPLVGAVTGPAFAAELRTPAQVQFEDSGGFTRGLTRRVFDWSKVTPAGAGRTGAGANMIFRRAALDRVGEVFPEELDAGTPTESGGDMYALYKLLSAGLRVVYDPATWVLHRHREDEAAMRSAFFGYGVGLSATLAKLLVEEGELGAVSTWTWLLRQYADARLRRLAGGVTESDVVVATEYLRGGLVGPFAWRRSRGLLNGGTAAPRRTGAPAEAPPERAREAPPGAPAVSVIVPTVARPDALARCLAALRRQAHAPAFEVLVVDDSPVPSMAAAPGGTRLLHTHGGGAAAARNAGAAAARGRLLLFLDDDLVPDPGLVARHVSAHAESRDRVVVGYCAPRPRRAGLAALGAIGWWEDHYRTTRELIAPTFVDVLSGNMSVSSESFARVGGFDAEFQRFRREDWEWGVRVLRAGVELVHDPLARADHEFTLDTRTAVARGFSEGRGDALLLARYPLAAGALRPVARRRDLLRWPRRGLLALVLSAAPARTAAVPVLDALERVKARTTWARLFRHVHTAAYQAGRRAGRREPPFAPLPLRVEIDSVAAIPAPSLAAREIEVTVGGVAVGSVRPSGGHWGRALADQLADAGFAAWWARAARRAHSALGRPGGYGAVVVAQRRGWDAVDRAVAAAGDRLVAVRLRRASLDARALDAVGPALAAERVAVALLAPAASDEPPGPVVLHSRETLPAPYRLFGRAPRAVVVDPAAYEQIAPAASGLGRYGSVLDLVERALDAGLVVAYAETDAVGEPSRFAVFRRADELLRWYARGGLMLDRARALGGWNGASWFLLKGALPAVYRTISQPLAPGRTIRAAAGAAAFGCGALRAAAGTRRTLGGS
jgi:GT2 family glycosyltransferase